MAIIKCDDVGIDAIISTGSFEAAVVTVEEYVEQNKVSLGKTLLAVESGFFLSDTLSPAISKVSPNLLETRPQDISDTLRADSSRYWTLDENGNMKYMNTNMYGFVGNVNPDSPPPTFLLARKPAVLREYTPLGLDVNEAEYVIVAAIQGESVIFDAALWKAFVDGAEGAGGSSYTDRDGNSFTRPTSLIPTGQTFTDHAFKMDTPFSKKELEMFANISDTVKFDVADVESDYDFFAKAYEEGIAPTNVPENALPHLYTEVQRGESEAENTDKVGFEAGYFREWINTVLPNQFSMDLLASGYENVAILDSVVSEDSILDSESKTTSAFEILMAYANRENLFPMNVNIEVGTNEASDVMFEAEDVGMVDDIVEMLMGDGDVTDSTPPEDEYDYGDWNWEGMGELGNIENVDFGAARQLGEAYISDDDEVFYGWRTVVSITKETGNNYDYSKKYEKEYDGDTWFSSQSGELYKEFRDAMEASKVKDFYKSNQGAYWKSTTFSNFINFMFEDINEFIEDKDRGSDGETYPKSWEYNSQYFGADVYGQGGAEPDGYRAPDDNHDDTRVNVEYTQDSTGYVRLTVQQWQEV